MKERIILTGLPPIAGIAEFRCPSTQNKGYFLPTAYYQSIF